MSLKKNKKVIIAMSGGVDSSVAALLLKNKYQVVEGLFMKNWEEDDNESYCHSLQDLADAQAVCDKLNITLHKINFSAEYWDNVFQYVLEEYQKGRTPNPDVLCNEKIKFNLFMNFCLEDLNADLIATGHYVRKLNINGQNRLLRAIDKNKDQSYFLYTLNQKQLQKSIFPIGEFTKPEVRRIANQYNLITFNKKDSTGICFIGKKNFRKFLVRYLPNQPGNIVSTDGKIIGKHQGLMYHTIGQRKGLGIGGIKNKTNNAPWYVVNKNIIKNTLIVAQGHNNLDLMSKGMIVNQLHWWNIQSLYQELFCTVKTRYRQTDVPCIITPQKNNLTRISVKFMIPISAITPGQSAVFYHGDFCLGGGIIEKSFTLV
ncbi:MAG: tRNA 2-thiouridine(34) synthase MnmA [Candidatus Dasytiphilus stammeri]